MRLIPLTLTLLLFCCVAAAQDTLVYSLDQEYEGLSISVDASSDGTEAEEVEFQDAELRQFDQKEIDLFKADDDFDYTEPDRVEGWWAELKRALADWWRRMQDNEATGFFFRHLDWILIGLLLVFVVLFLRKRALSGIFYKNVGGQGVLHSHHEVDIHQVDLDALLTKSEADGEYRQAVRFHYLVLLRFLNTEGHIEWRADKTDRQYLFEIKDAEVRSAFEDLSFIFKYVWYGELELGKGRYEGMAVAFRSFQRKAQRA